MRDIGVHYTVLTQVFRYHLQYIVGTQLKHNLALTKLTFFV